MKTCSNCCAKSRHRLKGRSISCHWARRKRLRHSASLAAITFVLSVSSLSSYSPVDHRPVTTSHCFCLRLQYACSNPKMCTGSIRFGGGALEDIVSLTPIGEPRQKITTTTLRDKKLRHEPITCLTAYDYASARLVDEAGIDIILVGDSLAMTMLGYENTLSVTVDEMLHHVRAARRGIRNSMLMADMPYGPYHVSRKAALRNAPRPATERAAEI